MSNNVDLINSYEDSDSSEYVDSDLEGELVVSVHSEDEEAHAKHNVKLDLEDVDNEELFGELKRESDMIAAEEEKAKEEFGIDIVPVFKG